MWQPHAIQKRERILQDACHMQYECSKIRVLQDSGHMQHLSSKCRILQRASHKKTNAKYTISLLIRFLMLLTISLKFLNRFDRITLNSLRVMSVFFYQTCSKIFNLYYFITWNEWVTFWHLSHSLPSCTFLCFTSKNFRFRSKNGWFKG